MKLKVFVGKGKIALSFLKCFVKKKPDVSILTLLLICLLGPEVGGIKPKIFFFERLP